MSIFSYQYFYVQAMQAALLALAIFAAYGTSKNRVLSFLAIYAIAVWFLVYKFNEYIGSGKLPMDLSALCYFIFGFCALIPVRTVKVAAAQLAALCGLVYGICMILLPQIFFARDPSEYARNIAMTNHCLLFFGGLTMMGHVKFKKRDLFTTALFVTAIVVYIEVCVAKGVAEGNAIFSQILNGSIILFVVPDLTLTWWYYAIYYPLLLALFGAWVALSYYINKKTVPSDLKGGFFAV